MRKLTLSAALLRALAVIASLVLAFWALLALLRQLVKFDDKTERELVRLAPDFQLKVRNWFIMCKLGLGIDMVIVSGLRTAAQQIVLHKQDSRNPLPVPGRPDVHMLGIAVDVNGWKDGKPVLLKASPVAAWQPVADLAGFAGLRWGHNFTGYDDRNHFDDK